MEQPNLIKDLYLAALFLIFLNSCSAVSSESVYEGIRSQQKAKGSSIEPKQQPLPSYQQYQKERETLKQ